MENNIFSTQCQSESGIANPVDTSKQCLDSATCVPYSQLQDIHTNSATENHTGDKVICSASLKKVFTSFEKSKGKERLELYLNILDNLKLGEVCDLDQVTPIEGVMFASSVYDAVKPHMAERKISAANVQQVNQAMYLPKFSIFAKTLYNKQIHLLSDNVDLDMVNALLMNCSKVLFKQLMSHISDVMPQIDYSKHVLINKELEEALRKELRPPHIKNMTSEVFINSALLYLLSVLNEQSASQVYKSIQGQIETCYP